MDIKLIDQVSHRTSHPQIYIMFVKICDEFKSSDEKIFFSFILFYLETIFVRIIHLQFHVFEEDGCGAYQSELSRVRHIQRHLRETACTFRAEGHACWRRD